MDGKSRGPGFGRLCLAAGSHATAFSADSLTSSDFGRYDRAGALDDDRGGAGWKVCALKRAVEDLRDPGLGVRLTGRVGELVLYEHAVVSSDAGTIPLAGLQARFESGRQTHSIYLTRPDGRMHRAKYPHRPVPAATDQAENVQFFDEDLERDFAVEIQNAVADENDFRAHLPAWLEQRQCVCPRSWPVRATTPAERRPSTS